MSESEKEAIQIKVVLIGESGVGKTSIINRYTRDTFTPGLPSTPGAAFTPKTINLKEYNQSIKFEIWDTAGQEIYRSLAKVFYKNAAVCVLVYDITRKKTFEELKNYWLEEIKANANNKLCKYIFILFIIFFNNIVLAIAANKYDLYEEEDVDENEAKSLAEEINAVFQKTSAKSANGIDDLFIKIGIKFLEKNQLIHS